MWIGHGFTNKHVLDSGRLVGDQVYSVFILMLLVSTHSLDPCLWGESDHPVFGPAYLTIWPAAASLEQGLSTNPGVTVWCLCGCS